jgi:hypothetical protein
MRVRNEIRRDSGSASDIVAARALLARMARSRPDTATLLTTAPLKSRR